MPSSFAVSLRRVAMVLCLVLTVPMAAQAADKPLLVFAAASLKNAMDGVAGAYEKTHPGTEVKISYAGSSTLARQIQSGAPADIYVSANQAWMDKLEQGKLIDKSSRYDLLGNSLVLIAPKDSDVHLSLKKHADLADELGTGNYLAMANTDSVPAGIYGRHALTYLGIWTSLQGHVAQAADVRAALHLVDIGQSPLGVVYSSDAVADKGNVRVVDRFPAASHKPIIYPVARVADSKNSQDAAFLKFLKAPQAAAIFKQWGFKVLAENG